MNQPARRGHPSGYAGSAVCESQRDSGSKPKVATVATLGLQLRGVANRNAVVARLFAGRVGQSQPALQLGNNFFKADKIMPRKRTELWPFPKSHRAMG